MRPEWGELEARLHAGLGERFEIVRRLGSGGMGAVYEAFDGERGELVALKTLLRTRPEDLYRFKREFRVAAGLRHPNLVELRDLVVTDELCYFTMEHIRGVELRAYCMGADRRAQAASDFEVEATTQMGQMLQPGADPTQVASPVRRVASDERRVRATLAQLASAVDALHAAGLVHRDIKPSNVMVEEGGRVVLLDYGLISELRRASTRSLRGELVGTLAYMAPEQVIADTDATAAADWYAMGAVIYELITGEPPFSGEDVAVLNAKLRLDPPLLREVCPDAPADLEALCAELLRRDPGTRPSGADVVGRLGGDPASMRMRRVSGSSVLSVGDLTPFVGRERELVRLEQAFGESQEGRPVVAMVGGPAGVGKSELIARFLQHGRAAGKRRVLRGRCHAREVVPHKGLDSIVDELSRALVAGDAPSAAAKEPLMVAVRKLFPVMGRVPWIAEARDKLPLNDPLESRARAYRGLRAILTDLAAADPLIAVLDDVQWIDQDTLRFLAELLNPPDPPAILLVLSGRDAPGEGAVWPWLQELVGVSVRDIQLRPLGAQAAEELARALLGTRAEASAVERVAAESGGNPFHLVELSAYVAAAGEWKGPAAGLDQLMAAHVARLPDDSRRILAAVAAAGEPLAAEVIAIAARIPLGQVKREVRTLVLGRLLRVASDDRELRVEASHDRLRAVMDASQTAEAREAVHRALALALTRCGAPVDSVARQWFAAGDGERAVELGLRAVDEAARAADYDRVADLYEMVLVAGGYDGDDARRALRRIGDARGLAGRPRDAANAYLSAAEHATGGSRLELRRRAGDQLMRGGYLSEGIEVMSGVLGELGMRLPATRRSAIASLLWHRTRLRARGLRFRRRDESEIPAAALTRVDAFWALGPSLAMSDTIVGALYCTRSLLTALRAGDASRVARSLAIEVSWLAAQGRTERARKAVHALDKLADGADVYVRALAEFARASVNYFCVNDWRAALRLTNKAAQLLRAHESAGWELDLMQLYECFALMQLGSARAIANRVTAYARDAQLRGDRFGVATYYTRLPLAWLADGRPDLAMARRDEALREWVPSDRGFLLQHLYALLGATDIDLYEGDADRAAARLREEVPKARAAFMMRVPLLAAELHDAMGRVALAQAIRGDDAQLAEARRCASRLRRIRLPAGAAYAELLTAGIKAREGNDVAAEEHLRAAVDKFDAHHMTLHAVVARSRLARYATGDEAEYLRGAVARFAAREGIAELPRLAGMLAPDTSPGNWIGAVETIDPDRARD